MAATSSAVSGPFLTINVAVFQLRIRASRSPGAATPSPSSAVMAVANSFRLSRGGTRSQRVMARMPPGSRRAMYASNASTV